MPKYNSLPLLTKLKIVADRGSDHPTPFRKLAANFADQKLSKSGIHDNLEKMINDVSRLESQSNTPFEGVRQVVRKTINQVMTGKCSLRDSAAVLRLNDDITIGDSTVQRIMATTGTICEGLNSKMDLSNITTPALDEIFQKTRPILGLTDPLSGLIMLRAAENRTEQSWKEFLIYLKNLGLNILGTVTDGGTGMSAALNAVFKNLIRMRDLFHVLKKLSSAIRKIDGTCYGLIVQVDKLIEKIEDEQNDCHLDTIAQLSQQLDTLTDRMNRAIELADDLEKLQTSLTSAVYFGDPQNIGKYVTSEDLAELLAHIVAKLEVFEKEIGWSKKVHDALTYIKNGRKAITAYKRVIEELIYEEFGEREGLIILRFILPVLEYMERSKRSYENRVVKAFWDSQVKVMRALLLHAGLSESDLIDLISRAKVIFSLVSQSSSLMECVNSVIRRYLISYKTIPKWFCPVFTFYWNHRIFRRGKRKGSSPVQLLTGAGHKHETLWIDQILDKFPLETVRAEIPVRKYLPAV